MRERTLSRLPSRLKASFIQRVFLTPYRELEAMLHCQIATASDLSLLRMSTSRPDESIAPYEPLQYAYDTPLCSALRDKFGDVDALGKIFSYAREATKQLGEWCADQLWRFALAEEETRKAERKTERIFLRDLEDRPTELLDAEVKRIREAKGIVENWTFKPPIAVGNNLSPKVVLLNSYLNLIFERPSDAKCIIFVKRRYTARLLKQLLMKIGSKNIRIDLLIGSRYGDLGDVKVSFRQQVLTLLKFRRGEVNCLVCYLYSHPWLASDSGRLRHLSQKKAWTSQIATWSSG